LGGSINASEKKYTLKLQKIRDKENILKEVRIREA
jgi:hypothetical protein